MKKLIMLTILVIVFMSSAVQAEVDLTGMYPFLSLANMHLAEGERLIATGTASLNDVDVQWLVWEDAEDNGHLALADGRTPLEIFTTPEGWEVVIDDWFYNDDVAVISTPDAPIEVLAGMRDFLRDIRVK